MLNTHQKNSEFVFIFYLSSNFLTAYKIPPKTNPPSDLEFLGDAYREEKINLSEDFEFHVLSNSKTDVIYEVNYKDLKDEDVKYPYKIICRKFVEDNHVFKIIYMRYSKIQEMSDKDKEMWIERLRCAA